MEFDDCEPETEREDGVKIYLTLDRRFLPVHPDGRRLEDKPTVEEALFAADMNWGRPKEPSHLPQPAHATRYRPVKRRRPPPKD